MSFGFAALVGRPNVGKSTLVNALVGQKVSIVSPVSQTTRSAVRAIVNKPPDQLVLVDTPGIHKPVTLLGKKLNEVSQRTLENVDLICFVVDAASGIGSGDRLLATWLPAKVPTVCVLNKIDEATPSQIAEQLGLAAQIGAKGENGEGAVKFDSYVPLSALSGDGIEILEQELFSRLPEGEAMFPLDMTSDQTESHLVGEIVREGLLLRMRDEIPHSIAVMVDSLEGLDKPDEVVRIECVIYVERDSQKGMVIGKNGVILKEVGTAARLQCEALLGRRIFLQLRVKVSQNWQRRADRLSRMGY